MVETTTKFQQVTFCYNQVGSLCPIGEGVSPTQINSIIHNNINGAKNIKCHNGLCHLDICAMHEMKQKHEVKWN